MQLLAPFSYTDIFNITIFKPTAHKKQAWIHTRFCSRLYLWSNTKLNTPKRQNTLLEHSVYKILDNYNTFTGQNVQHNKLNKLLKHDAKHETL